MLDLPPRKGAAHAGGERRIQLETERRCAVGAESIVTSALRAGVRAVILEAGDDAGSLTYRMVRQALEGRGGLGSLEDRKADIKAAMQVEWSLVEAEQSAAGNISVDGTTTVCTTRERSL